MLFKLANVVTGSDSQTATKADHGASLTSILDTPILRIELTLLVLLCTDTMRSGLAATFDPEKSNTADLPSPTLFPSSPKPTQDDLISFDAAESIDYMAPQPSENDIAAAREKARRVRGQEVSSTQMQGLRRAALTYFDKWRAGVMQRVCDVLGVRGEVVRNAKAKRKAALDAVEKERLGRSLLDLDDESEEKEEGDREMRYPAIKSRLEKFDLAKRVLMLHCLLLLLLSLEHYPAHSRVLLLHLASSLRLSTDTLAEHEKTIAQGLLASASQMDGDEAAKKKAAQDSDSRKWKVGLAAVGGAVLIGVTGGLAAPLLAAGVGSVMGGIGFGASVVSGYLGALAGSSVLVGSLFGAYGAKMTGRLMNQYAKEVEDFQFIPIRGENAIDEATPESQQQHRLRVVIGISGWLTTSADVSDPWDIIDGSGIEPFALRWELNALLRLGTSLTKVAMSYAWEGAKIAIVRRTLLGALYAGLWPLGLVKIANVLDNPFSIAVARSDKAGKVLAHALISKVQGERPVTLIGYSLGARVIYSCLLELAQQNAFGLVESVVLMGAPTPSESRTWRQIRAVVSARVVNVYSTEDYILGFLYRTSKLQFGIAGLQVVSGVPGVENVNMSSLVTGHDRYRYLVGTILSRIGFEDVDAGKVEEQVRVFRATERKKEKIKEMDKQHFSEVLFDIEENQRESKNAKEPTPTLPPRPSTQNSEVDIESRQTMSRNASSSSTNMRQSRLTLEDRTPTLPPQPAIQDSLDEEDNRIRMEDFEDRERPLMLPMGVPTASAVFTSDQPECSQLNSKDQVVNADTDSDAGSIASVPLGELTMREPLPEPGFDMPLVH